MDVEELAGEVRQNIMRLRRELAEEEKFLTRLESRVAGTRESEPALPAAVPAQVSGEARGTSTVSGTLTVSGRGEKRTMVREMLSTRPGRWTTRQVRDELTRRGIDPEAGTPVKNILWQLAKDDFLVAHGSGEYEFPATGRDNGQPPQEEMTP